MNYKDFVKKILNYLTIKTLYVTGGLGNPLTDSNKQSLITQYAKNQREPRRTRIMNADSDTWAFDCIGMVKTTIWGWCGDITSYIGGGEYESNGLPDCTVEQMIAMLYDRSTDFEEIQPGEICYMYGHVGVYVGNRMSVECTSKWDGMIQITSCNYDLKDMWRREWTGHGKLPMIDYNEEVDKMYIYLDTDLKKGDRGDKVKDMQLRICQLSYDYEQQMLTCSFKDGKPDGSFGAGTEKIIKAIQSDAGLRPTGKLDSLLRGVLNFSPMAYHAAIKDATAVLSSAGR